VQQRYVSKVVQDFERNRLQLEEAKQQEVQAWKQKLSKLALQYQMNLTEETTEVTFSPEELKGLSDDFIGSLEKGNDGKFKVYLLHLRRSYMPNTQRTDDFAALST
jgi:Zn-dependent oligopeptidase